MLPGAVLARMLADFGARVIKVEDPVGGDPLRNAPPAGFRSPRRSWAGAAPPTGATAAPTASSSPSPTWPQRLPHASGLTG
jgi:crotonobetainyl-CoA:carnitine CoA-transferase CaiB-like acyl-CoA transferase